MTAGELFRLLDRNEKIFIKFHGVRFPALASDLIKWYNYEVKEISVGTIKTIELR